MSVLEKELEKVRAKIEVMSMAQHLTKAECEEVATKMAVKNILNAFDARLDALEIDRDINKQDKY